MEEGTDDIGAVTEAAPGGADVLAEDRQVGRAEAAEGMLLQPGPELLIGIEFGSVDGVEFSRILLEGWRLMGPRSGSKVLLHPIAPAWGRTHRRNRESAKS